MSRRPHFEGVVPRARTPIDGASQTSSLAAAKTGREGSPRLWPIRDGGRPAHGTTQRAAVSGSRAPASALAGRMRAPKPPPGALLPRTRSGSSKELLLSGLGSLVSPHRAARRVSDPVMTKRPWARNASGRTSFIPARSTACGARAPLCVLLNTGKDGMSLDCPAEPPPFDPDNEKDRLELSPVMACATGGQTTRQHRLELPTIVWSVVPPVRDSPPPTAQTSRSGPLPSSAPAQRAADHGRKRGPASARPRRRSTCW